MDVPRYRTLRFPGEAGRRQAANDIVGLAKELGANYATYHRFLAERLSVTGRPDPADYRPDFDAYARACTSTEELLNAEMFLRRCRAKYELGASLNHPLPPDTPVVDERHQLVSAAQRRSTIVTPAREVPKWDPPPPAGSQAADDATRAVKP